MLTLPDEIAPWLEGAVAFFMIAGSVFAVIGALGLLRFRDFFQRLHGPTKSSTLGVGCTLIASMIFFWWRNGAPNGQELLITLFLMITAPISAHLLAMSGMHHQLKRQSDTRGEPYELHDMDDQR